MRLSSIDEGANARLQRTRATLRLPLGTPRDLIRVDGGRGFQIEEEEFNKSFDAALREIQQASVREQETARAKANPLRAGRGTCRRE